MGLIHKKNVYWLEDILVNIGLFMFPGPRNIFYFFLSMNLCHISVKGESDGCSRYNFVNNIEVYLRLVLTNIFLDTNSGCSCVFEIFKGMCINLLINFDYG